MTITAAVDGSALGNPGPAGWAWVVSEDAWAAGGFDRATNNVGELTALAKLLEDTADAGFADQPLVVLADSQYVINSVTKWMPGWKRRGWKKADGKPVQNRELLERIDRAIRDRDVRLKWVKGHAGHDMNEAADLRARAAAEAHKKGTSVHAGPAFTQTMGSRTAGAAAAARTERGRPGAAPDLHGWASWRDEGEGNPMPAALPEQAASGRGDQAGSSAAPAERSAGSGDLPGEREVPAAVDCGRDGEPSAPPEPAPGGVDESPAGGPIVAVSAAEATRRWAEVLESARKEPVTITERGQPPLLLMDADVAWRALALLDEDPAEEGTLF